MTELEHAEVEGLSQNYIDSQDRKARRLMSKALQHFGAAPIKWGIGGFMLSSAISRLDLVVAIIGGAIMVWGFGDLGRGGNQFISARDINKQVLTLRSALTRKLTE